MKNFPSPRSSSLFLLLVLVVFARATAQTAINYAESRDAGIVRSLVDGFVRQGGNSGDGLVIGRLNPIRWSASRRVPPRRGRPVLYPADYRKEPKGGVFVGQVRFAVVANLSNPVSCVALNQLRTILEDSDSPPDWQDLDGRAGRVRVYADIKTPSLSASLKRLCLHYLRENGGVRTSGFYAYGKQVIAAETGKICGLVQMDRRAVGIVSAGKVAKGVKVLDISVVANSRPMRALVDKVVVSDYPLLENYYLLLPNTSPAVLTAFVDFVVGEEGAAIAEKHGLLTGWRQWQRESDTRLAEMKSGKGVRLSSVGIVAGRGIFQGLATEFVRAKEVVQLSYASVSSDVASVDSFVGGEGKREVLVLGGRPGMRAMELHGEKWNALGRDEQGKPDGTGLAEYVIASRAVGIIVNPANKIKSLTLGQIQAIYSGEILNWAVFGETGLSAPVGPGGRPGEIRIHSIGLFEREPATAVFASECLPRDKWRGVTSKRNTAADKPAIRAVGPPARRRTLLRETMPRYEVQAAHSLVQYYSAKYFATTRAS